MTTVRNPDAWFRALLDSALAKVSGTAEGGRNATLYGQSADVFRAAAALRREGVSGVPSDGELESALMAAGTACGLKKHETHQCLMNGRQAAEQDPSHVEIVASAVPDSERTWGVSRFRDAYSPVPKQENWTWKDVVEALAPDLPRVCGVTSQTTWEDQKKRNPAFAPATFDGNRSKVNAQAVSMLVWDYDDGTPFSEAIRPWRGFRWVAYATWSNTAEQHGTNPGTKTKYRIVMPLQGDVPAEKWPDVWQWARSRAVGEPDSQAKDSSRMYFLPAQPEDVDSFTGEELHRAWWRATSEDSAPLLRWQSLERKVDAFPPAVRTVVEPLTLRRGLDSLIRMLEGGNSSSLWPWPWDDLDDGGTGSMHQAESLEPEGDPPPGWANMRRATGGALRPDSLLLVVGPTKRGKTSWLVNVAAGAAGGGKGAPVLYVSAELSAPELVARLLSLRSATLTKQGATGVAYRDILRGRVKLEAIKASGMALVNELPGFYVWSPSAGERTPDHLAKRVAAVSSLHGGAPVFLCLDYLQRFGVQGEALRQGTRDASGTLRDLTRPNETPPGGVSTDVWPEGTPWPGGCAVVLSSTSRMKYRHVQSVRGVATAPEHPPPKKRREDPEPTTLADLQSLAKESGDLEYDASAVAVLTSDATGAGVVRVVLARYTEPGTAAMFYVHHATGLWTPEPDR